VSAIPPSLPARDLTGKSFERLVARIQQQLAPHARVTHDVTIVGRSGARNQCDVLVDGKVGPYDVRLLVECKDWTSTVGVEVVRGVVEKAQDVGAHRAVIVCREGFSSDAIHLATHRGVVLQTVADAESEDWASIGVYPVEVFIVEAGRPTLTVLTPERSHVITLADDAGVALPFDAWRCRNSSTGAVLTLDDLVAAVWDQPRVCSFEGEAYELYSPAGAFALIDGETEFEIVARVTGTLHRAWRWGHLPFDRGWIVRDAVTGSHVHQSFETTLVQMASFLSWPQVASKDDIPITASLSITLHLGWGSRGYPIDTLQISVASGATA
jgi:hypothetical protein